MAYRQDSGTVTNLANLTDNAVVRGDGGAAGVQTSSVLITDNGEMTNPLQPSFLAYLNTTVTEVTGDGTNYTIIFDTEVYDQNNDFTLASSTFTAPVTGRYRFDFGGRIIGGTSIGTGGAVWFLNTSNNTFRFQPLLPTGTTATAANGTVLCDLDVNDTATLSIQITDTGGKVDDIAGVSSGIRTWFSGDLQE